MNISVLSFTCPLSSWICFVWYQLLVLWDLKGQQRWRILVRYAPEEVSARIKNVLYSVLSAPFPPTIEIYLSDPSGTDLSLVFSSSSSFSPSPPSSSWPVSDYYYKCLIYHIQAWGSPQPIHFLKAHHVSSPNTDENTNTKTKTVTKTMTKTKTPREWPKQ